MCCSVLVYIYVDTTICELNHELAIFPLIGSAENEIERKRASERENEKVRERVYVNEHACICEKETGRECVCVKERDRERMRDSERECVRE